VTKYSEVRTPTKRLTVSQCRHLKVKHGIKGEETLTDIGKDCKGAMSENREKVNNMVTESESLRQLSRQFPEYCLNKAESKQLEP